MAWFLGLLALIALALVFVGCADAQWAPVEPTTVNESIVLAETERFSRLLGVHVTGHVTNSAYIIGHQYAAGWYVGQNGKGAVGDAYYYIPTMRTLRPAVTDGPESVVNVASHEVCHAVTGPDHNLSHWECMGRFATPTYPRPQ
jgi:hypothetical protein